MSLIIFFLSLFFQSDVPQKPSAEYTLKFDLKFKSEQPSNNKFEVNDATGAYAIPRQNLNLPFLTLHLKLILLAPEETRIRIHRGAELYTNRKVKVTDEIKIELGFIADIKDKIVPNEYIIHFLNDDKKPVSQIHIYFDEDGFYIVNGEKRGKI